MFSTGSVGVLLSVRPQEFAKLTFTSQKCLGIAIGNTIVVVHKLFWGNWPGITVTVLASPRIHECNSYSTRWDSQRTLQVLIPVVFLFHYSHRIIQKIIWKQFRLKTAEIIKFSKMLDPCHHDRGLFLEQHPVFKSENVPQRSVSVLFSCQSDLNKLHLHLGNFSELVRFGIYTLTLTLTLLNCFELEM